MKIYFIRHGQTDWNTEGRIQGSYDSELNETGRQQAKELSKKVIEEGYKFSQIYTSLQKRARKTAEILNKELNLELIPTKGLEEINLGDWEGMTWTEVKEKCPKEFEEWYHNKQYGKTHNGESYQEVLDRILTTVNTIIINNKDNEDIAIVTHGAVIKCLLCYINNIPLQEMYKFETKNTSIIEIDSNLLTSYALPI